MFILISRRYLNAALAMVGLLSLSLLTVAVHPHFEDWRREGIVITQINTTEKVIAITFDDGPQPGVTPQLLKILSNHDANATFFVLGVQAEKYPQVVIDAHQAGNEIANHGYSHKFTHYKRLDYAITDIEKASRVIRKLTGENNRLFRPPGGFLSDKMVDYCRRQDLKIIAWTWNQDTKDWSSISGTQIASHILKNLEPGQIIILHDGGSHRKEMQKGVDLLLDGLEDKGYRAVTVSELLTLAN